MPSTSTPSSDSSPPSRVNPRTQRLLILFGLALSLGLVYAFVLYRMRPAGLGESSGDGTVLAQPAESQEIFGEVQPFALVERSGKTVTRDELTGHAWIAAFVFTRCTGPCPRISGNMRKLQDRLASEDVRLVTFTVDPEYDTPTVLTEYAKNLGADPVRWLFLTGKPAEIQQLSVGSFLLPIERDASQPVGRSVTHRTVLTVVDKKGRIRGYYDGETDAGVAKTAARAKFLAHESTP
jgi:protein SCO1/2